MTPFSDHGDAIDAIVRFDRERFSTLPDHVQAEMTRLAGLGISPVDRIVRTAEALFANRSKLTRNADRLLVAGLAEYAARNGWHGLNGEDRRGFRIAATMQAAAGEDVTIADEDVPEPLAEFLPPTEAAVGSPPPAPGG